MIKIGYHASHEQFSPSYLLKMVIMAEQAGFKAALSSDHIHPWSEKQGESAFAWSWLGAAMQATSLEYGVVNAPGQRYHPAIIAQAAATLEEMFPNRFWLCQGSGQALNEAITGDKWPTKEERNARLLECVEITRALWRGERVSHYGFVTVEESQLYTLPKTPPAVIGAAITPKTAAWMGDWTDGLITISKPKEELQKVVDAYRSNGGEDKPMILKLHMSYHADEQKARSGAFEQWKTNILGDKLQADLKSPEQLEQAAKYVRPEDVEQHVHITSSPGKIVELVNMYAEMGFEKIILHNVNLEQEQFIRAFGEKIQPQLKGLTQA
ncbi:F420-dependent oxidoreductase [Flammeovirgaceae bacterium 311]|nr:F420-dependent oxidoreductase [Flammeovirgaceae bacterium 311]